MRTRPSAHRRAVTLLLGSALVASMLTAPAGANTVAPQLKLIATSDNLLIERPYGQPIYLDLGLSIASLGAPFELRGVRPDYTQPPVLSQTLYSENGNPSTRELPAELLDGWNGLNDFIKLDFVKRGVLKLSSTMDFCPNSYLRERVSDRGPDRPRYPAGCFTNPFTKGMVWGIDEDWAVGVAGYDTPPVLLPQGRYQVTASIDPLYVELFEIDPAEASVTVPLHVRTVEDACYECGKPHGSQRTQVPAGRGEEVPIVEDPATAGLPDLAALPAWGIAVENGRRRSRLSFGATVWNGGASDLVVEGFKRSGEAVMDGYQYFYEAGEAVGKAPVGTLEYDTRDGHDHWHFLQFAGYSLLDSTQSHVLRSKKEAFCLAPTDAIDLALPHADWNPGVIGLTSACGSKTSMWTREILPAGWGDTYFQGLPGQSFNITNLPNGTYYIKVEANPAGLLHEQSAANNAEVRQVILKGKPGHRRVIVPLWNGIDTEDRFREGY